MKTTPKSKITPSHSTAAKLCPAPLSLYLGIAASLSLAACGTNASLKSAQQKFRAGNINGALASIRSEDAKQKSEGKDASIISLEHGSIALAAGQSVEALEALRKADQAIQYRDGQPVVLLGREAGAMLTNLNSIPYNTSPSEKIMGASLLAVSFAETGELQKARSSIKLAKNRQKDYLNKFSSQIEIERQSLQQAVTAQKGVSVKLPDDKINGTLKQLDESAAKLQPYAKFTVPYAEVLAGILLGSGPNPDVVGSRQSFGMAKAANPASNQIQKAMKGSLAGTTHILVEEGVAPHLGSTRLDMALSINNKPVIFSAAFPTFQETPLARPESLITVGGQTIQADPICDFDRVAADEFRRKIKGTVARTVAASSLKSVISYVGQEALQSAGGKGDSYAQIFALASGIYNAASAQADERIWASLPKYVRYAVIPTPASGSVAINGYTVNLPKDGSTKVVIARNINGNVNAHSFGL
jgi:hypothetical protein